MRARGKRNAIVDRFHKGSEKKRESGGTESGAGSHLGEPGTDASNEDGGSNDESDESRRIFFNIPLPDDARDEEGSPLMLFKRNKIRTAKYTPLTFIPKNLYHQFQTIANAYFLFLIILVVSIATLD